MLRFEAIRGQPPAPGTVTVGLFEELHVHMVGSLDRPLTCQGLDSHEPERGRRDRALVPVGLERGLARDHAPFPGEPLHHLRTIGVAWHRREPATAAGRAAGLTWRDSHGGERPRLGSEQQRRPGGTRRLARLRGVVVAATRGQRHAGRPRLRLDRQGRLRDIEEQVFLGRQVGERRGEGLVHLLEQLAARPLGLGLLAGGERLEDVALDRRGDGHERVERGVGHDPRAGARRERQGLEVEEAHQPSVVPRGVLEGEQFGDRGQHAGAVLAEGDAGCIARVVAAHVDLHAHVPQRRRIAARDLQPLAVELTGHHPHLPAGHRVDHVDLHTGEPDAVAEFRREVAGDLLARDEVFRRFEERSHHHPRAAGGQPAADRADLVLPPAPHEP